MKKEEIHFGSMGNGITVWDSTRTRNGDYLTVAHISYDRKVTFREKVSPGAQRRIENYAKYHNSHPVSQPEKLALYPIKGSAFMSSGEKGCYLRDNENDCATENITRFLQEAWDDARTPPENLTLFREWLNKGAVDEYL